MRRAANGCLCVCRLINARKHSAPNEWGVARTLHAIAVSAILANCTAIAQHRDIYDFRANSTAHTVAGEERVYCWFLFKNKIQIQYNKKTILTFN